MLQVRGLSRHRCLGRLVRQLVAQKLPVVLAPQQRDGRAGTALARRATRARSFMQEFPRLFLIKGRVKCLKVEVRVIYMI